MRITVPLCFILDLLVLVSMQQFILESQRLFSCSHKMSRRLKEKALRNIF